MGRGLRPSEKKVRELTGLVLPNSKDHRSLEAPIPSLSVDRRGPRLVST